MNHDRLSKPKQARRFIVGAVAQFALVSGAYTATFDEVLTPIRQATDKCHTIDGQHAWSSQARSLYEKEGFARTLGLEPVAKFAESFECGKVKATVYLYSYATRPEAEKALSGVKTYIWGGPGRTMHHPEYIFAVDNVVVVVSGQKPKPVAEILRPKQAQGRWRR